MKVFETGQTYSTRSICDYEHIVSFVVVRRTPKTIRVLIRGKEKTFRPGIYDGKEFVRPWGNYSMCPIICADDIGLKKN